MPLVTYGAGALGGVISYQRYGQPFAGRATFDGGSHDTFRGSFFGAAEKNAGTRPAREGVRTDGAYVLAPEVRGAVDTRADSDYKTGFGGAGWRGGNWHVTGRGAGCREDRSNGTVVRSTHRLEADVDPGRRLSRQRRTGAQRRQRSQDYYQTFSAVAAIRATERLTFAQFIDTSHRGSGQWARPIGKVTMIVGSDYRHTDSVQDEFRYVW